MSNASASNVPMSTTPMDFKDIVKSRRSIRKYQEKPVPDELIEELVEMIGLSVSAINLQPWKVKVVKDQGTKDQIFAATFGMEHARTCSHLLILCAYTDYPALIGRLSELQAAAGVPEEMWRRTAEFATTIANRMSPEERLVWSQQQVYIALGNALNGAYALGLGGCPMTAFDSEEVARVLSLPPTIVPTVMVSLGYAAEEGTQKLRFPVREILL
jgi:nitroreductase / dihydropteridine reductase